jgi:8-oxo-dGTP diphosphatase
MGQKVAFAFVTYKGKVLLFHRDDKVGIDDPGKWSLIGGNVEDGESFEKALIREVKEEINISVTDPKFLFPRQGLLGHDGQCFHIPLSELQAQSIKLGDEGQEVKFFTFEEMGKLPLTVDLKAIYNDRSSLIKETI